MTWDMGFSNNYCLERKKKNIVIRSWAHVTWTILWLEGKVVIRVKLSKVCLITTYMNES